MAFIQDLPNEIMLKVINYLYIKDLVELGEVSKKISAICSDQSLWQKIIRSKDTPKLFHMDAQGCWIYDIDVPVIPTDFMKRVIENGCQYLSLHYMKLGTPVGPISLPKLRLLNYYRKDINNPLSFIGSLRYLDLKHCEADVKTFEEILASCHRLQKLSMASITQSKPLTSNMIRSICYQNGHCLQTLNLSYCIGLDLDSIMEITKNCIGLKNIDLFATQLSKDSISFLVNNLTPQLETLSLGNLSNLKDQHVKALVNRCNKLSVVNFQNTKITNDSLTYIIKHLQHTLEKLNVFMCNDITYAKLTELKSMPKLKVLKSAQVMNISDHEKENLKKMTPLERFGDSIRPKRRKLKQFWNLSEPCLETLPQEVLSKVIHFLDVKDLRNFSQVSKMMRFLTMMRT